MADPLSITASVVGIVATTAQTIHATIGLIDEMRDAPSTIGWIRNELQDVEQSQIQNNHTTDRIVSLLTQEKEPTRLHAVQRAVIEELHSEKQRLQLVKAQAEDADSIENMDRAAEDLHDVSRARIAISQFATASEYIAKSSIATRTNQDIGKVVIAELGYGAVGISNVEKIDTVKQKIGDVSVGSGGTGFIGIHGKVDHNAALAGRWTSGNKS
ncbi:hypothetical protein D6D06_06868 [Aureobasidium pullulans]|nr:hypothetical protein D6D06_06868 [Aureobasidium pullulans]